MAGRAFLRNLQYMCVGRWASLSLRLQVLLDYAVQTAGPLYIILGFSLISTVIYLFFAAVLPAIYDIFSSRGIMHLILSLWLIFNVFFNYFWCIHTDPGTVPSQYEPTAELSKYESGTAQIRWCKRCRKPKPPMTHHCHVCKRCVLKMDHHCPWMHNCIGFYNYRYFFSFMVYLWTGCVYTTLMASIPLFRSPDTLRLYDDWEDFLYYIDTGKLNGVLFTFVLALAVLASLSCLLGWHIYLVGSSQTTIDFYANRQRRKEARRAGEVWVNEFNMGALQNFANLFALGYPCWWWLSCWLPSRRLPRGDGTHFPTVPSSPDLLKLSNSSIQGGHRPLYYYLSRTSTAGSTAISSTSYDELLTEEIYKDSDMV